LVLITINVGRLCIRTHADTWNNYSKSIPSDISRLANYHTHRVVIHTWAIASLVPFWHNNFPL